MSLVTMKEMLADAQARRYAVPAFNVCNYEMIRAIARTAEELHSPVILGLLKADLEGDRMRYLVALCRTAAELCPAPVCIHLDHATELSLVKAAVDGGFTSVMYDGSVLPFEENSAATIEACVYAHRRGVSVEAELGHVANGIVGMSENEGPEEDGHLTSVEEAERFVELTGVDALAVAIGTAHGIYLKEPVLDLERLERIRQRVAVPLVLHGGSGTPDAAVSRSIELGICKINIFSEVLCAMNAATKETFAGLSKLNEWPVVTSKGAIEAVSRVAAAKMRHFGSAGRV
jgi:ketose-bisphosphate aldolase